jgi:hypothetical protein
MKTLAALLIALLAGASSSAEVMTGKFPLNLFVSAADCPQLSADLSGNGTGNFVERFTVDDHGLFHLGFTFNAHGTATDADGNQYIFNHTDVDSFSGPASGLPMEETFIENLNLIGQGGAPNVPLKGVFHIRILPDGTVTAFVDTSRGNEGCEAFPL